MLILLGVFRGCPKAYHPSCVNRDEAFFRAKGRWNCGKIAVSGTNFSFKLMKLMGFYFTFFFLEFLRVFFLVSIVRLTSVFFIIIFF